MGKARGQGLLGPRWAVAPVAVVLEIKRVHLLPGLRNSKVSADILSDDDETVVDNTEEDGDGETTTMLDERNNKWLAEPVCPSYP